MEGFIEQVVKRDKTAKNTVIKIVSVVLLFLIPLTFVFLSTIITPYLAMVGFFIFLGGIYVVWWIFSLQKVEFEYSISGDSLDISKIISLRRRKKMLRVEIKDIEMLEIGDQKVKNMGFRKVYNAAKNFNNTKENYYATFTTPVYGKCLIVFNPNEAIMEGMKPYLRRELVLQHFYNRSN